MISIYLFQLIKLMNNSMGLWLRQSKNGVERPELKESVIYYIGVKTKVVRAPVEVANKISDMLGMFNKIKSLVNSWDERISEAASKSATGKPSPKYERAIEPLK